MKRPDTILELRELLKPYSEVQEAAKDLGVARSTIYDWAKSLGYRPTKKLILVRIKDGDL